MHSDPKSRFVLIITNENVVVLNGISLQEDVPSSGVNVTEFITNHENDLSLPSLGHGISAQFMFSPDPGWHFNDRKHS